MTQSYLLKNTKLPLTLAVSSCLLVACNSTPTTTQTQTVTIPNNTTYNTSTATQNTSALDAETLAILEDLLEARDMSMVEGDRLAVEQYGNLWDRVRRGYRIQQPSYNARIEAQKAWFAGRQAYLDRLTARASRYLHHTVTEAERRGIPTELALLPIIESSYDPSATSNAAAAGLWQFIPSTGRIYGLNQSGTYDGRRDVIESTRAAYDFLTSLYNQFGTWELALAAYNAGPGRIQRAIDANRAQGLPTDYWSLRLPTETMNYVPRFMAVAQIVANPSQYNVYFPAIANHNHFRTVPVQYGATLYDVSAVTNVPVSELQLLNPALTNLIVDQSGPSRVVIPDSLPMSVDENLRKLGSYGFGNATVQTGYVVSHDAVPNPASAQALSASNTLPTTAATVTPNKTIMQEPPLSQEEVDFIAAQIRSTESSAQPINPADRAIELNAVQTAQSVLDARGEQKSLSFAAATPLSNNTPSSANVTTGGTRPTNAESYRVQSGDTLTSIATRHNLTVAQLAAYNNIPRDTRVREGQQLWLVAGKVNASTAAPTQTNNSTRTTNYKVQRGDTLIGLANRLGVSKAEIAALNDFDENANLIADTTIKIPVVSTNTNNDRSTQNSQATGRAIANTESYQVKQGETLTALASRYGVSVTDLARTNNLASNARLQVGQTILVPKLTTTYTVRQGDTLIGLARRYGVQVDELAAMNKIKSTDGLRIGQTLIVPNK